MYITAVAGGIAYTGVTFLTANSAPLSEYVVSKSLGSLTRCFAACRMSHPGCVTFSYNELTGLNYTVRPED